MRNLEGCERGCGLLGWVALCRSLKEGGDEGRGHCWGRQVLVWGEGSKEGMRGSFSLCVSSTLFLPTQRG